MTRPKPMTAQQVEQGYLPTWSENYAEWLSTLPSFQNQNNRARMGRIKARRRLLSCLTFSLTEHTEVERLQIEHDIVMMARLKVNAQ